MKGAFEKLSLVIIARDAEDSIASCIGSVPDAGEVVVVVDSDSKDRTAEIARTLGAKVYFRAFVSAADQKNWAIEQARGDWILVLDADEKASSKLVSEIASELGAPRADGYWISRKSEFLGSRIRFCGWQGEKLIRLFKRGKGRYPERAVHEKLFLSGSSRNIGGWIEHKPYRSLSDYLARMESYSKRGAEDLHGRGSSWFPAILLNPPVRFMRMYFLQLGFLDGIAGFLLCSLAAFGVFLKYAYLRELKRVSDDIVRKRD